VSPSVASVTASIEPVMATFVGTVVLKEPSTIVMFIGIFVILVSIFVLNYKGTKVR
jgi:drug/metabolite transporter (DMT)-like permease